MNGQISLELRSKMIKMLTRCDGSKAEQSVLNHEILGSNTPLSDLPFDAITLGNK